MANEQHCLFIALMGAPNAGKSTLVNQLVGTKVSIVSPKVQTTRASIRGICMEGAAQLIFIDTPGIFLPKQNLERAIVQEAWRRVAEADQLALLVDAKRGLCADTARIIESLQQQQRKAVLILNKIDVVEKEKLLALAQGLNDTGLFTQIFMVSALHGDGTDAIKRHFASIAPASPWMFPEDQLSDAPVRFFAAEVTREKIFMYLQQELPYSVAVETEKWEDTEKGDIKIHQAIYVQKPGQKKILLGKGGSMIKRIGAEARKELSHLLGTKVHLFLFVKIRENWTENPSMYREIGLEYK